MRTANDGHVRSGTKGLHSPKISGKFPIATADCLSSFGKCLTITCGTFFCPKTLEIKILQQIKVRPFCQSLLYFHLTNNLRSNHFLLLHTRGVNLDSKVLDMSRFWIFGRKMMNSCAFAWGKGFVFVTEKNLILVLMLEHEFLNIGRFSLVVTRLYHSINSKEMLIWKFSMAAPYRVIYKIWNFNQWSSFCL